VDIVVGLSSGAANACMLRTPPWQNLSMDGHSVEALVNEVTQTDRRRNPVGDFTRADMHPIP